MSLYFPARAALLASICSAALLVGCTQPPPSIPLPGADAQSVNVGNSQSFFPDQTSDNPDPVIPTLKQMEAQSYSGDNSPKDVAEQTVRLPALRDAALRYGVEDGLAYSTGLVNQVLRADAEGLSRAYDFNRLVTMEPGGAMILPPVISESKNAYEETDSGAAIRVAGTTYDIIREAQFAPTSPLWYSYLYRPVIAPAAPPSSLLPKTDEEHSAWVQYVDAGWKVGIQQGLENFKLDTDRLNQDFVGMIRYRTLYDAAKVSAPIVQNYDLGTTGTGKTMREGDRVERIIAEPLLQAPAAPANMPFSEDGHHGHHGHGGQAAQGANDGGGDSPLNQNSDPIQGE